MKIIYIDSDFKCHLTNDGTMTEVQTEVFDGKCDKYIEGYRYVPQGEKWTREDGTVFNGEMIAPHIDSRVLTAYQEQYEESQEQITELEAQNADMSAALTTIYTGVSE